MTLPHDGLDVSIIQIVKRESQCPYIVRRHIYDVTQYQSDPFIPFQQTTGHIRLRVSNSITLSSWNAISCTLPLYIILSALAHLFPNRPHPSSLLKACTTLPMERSVDGLGQRSQFRQFASLKNSQSQNNILS